MKDDWKAEAKFFLPAISFFLIGLGISMHSDLKRNGAIDPFFVPVVVSIVGLSGVVLWLIWILAKKK